MDFTAAYDIEDNIFTGRLVLPLVDQKVVAVGKELIIKELEPRDFYGDGAGG